MKPALVNVFLSIGNYCAISTDEGKISYQLAEEVPFQLPEGTNVEIGCNKFCIVASYKDKNILPESKNLNGLTINIPDGIIFCHCNMKMRIRFVDKIKFEFISGAIFKIKLPAGTMLLQRDSSIHSKLIDDTDAILMI